MASPHDPGQFGASPHATDDQILDLANGLAIAEDDSALLAHLRACPSCEERLRGAAAEREILRAEPRPRLENGEVVLAGTASAGHASARRHPRQWWLAGGAVAVAAALALLLMPWGSDPPPSVGPPSMERWIPVDQALTMLRSSTATEATDLLAALEVYQTKNVREAVEYLENASVPAGSRTFAALQTLLLADTYIRDDVRAEEALQLLDEIDLPTLPEPWRREGRWVRYRALHAIGRHDECLAMLELLRDMPGEIGDMARSALRAEGIEDNGG